MNVYISIKPIYVEQIKNREKTYEFRNYIPKKEFDKLYIYESYPVCTLKYIMELESIVKYPNKIEENGKGNDMFNTGKGSKYAYKIKHLYELKEPLHLSTLKTKFNFNPPQSYAYSDTYQQLTDKIEEIGYILLY